jgi:hypothetical protein
MESSHLDKRRWGWRARAGHLLTECPLPHRPNGLRVHMTARGYSQLAHSGSEPTLGNARSLSSRAGAGCAPVETLA